MKEQRLYSVTIAASQRIGLEIETFVQPFLVRSFMSFEEKEEDARNECYRRYPRYSHTGHSWAVVDLTDQMSKLNIQWIEE